MDLRVGIGAFLLAKGGHNIDEATVVLHPPLGPASLLLLLLLFGHLRKGRTDWALADRAWNPFLQLLSRWRRQTGVKDLGLVVIAKNKVQTTTNSLTLGV